ncbi:dienelactone hydrolase family protein [Roseomonas sp. GC11]|uniref:dienelactone hydrolase family protein n=1 Tax=Roseomonas sp. GC11 TaxID=2950546 RepID=UPI002108D34A|nr:dienelactone hydrolase family protein [Roseomonas sp. GC11]MCQ4161791.1 dienelactone hydrolase family protein [Roseomonas sp. GC11]
MPRCLLLLLAALLAACAAPAEYSSAETVPQSVQGDGPVQIPPVPVAGARTAPQPLPGWLRLPPGPGPHPVVILLHGCGGLGSNQTLWAKRLLEWGYGSLTVDSLKPRGTGSVCPPDKQPLVTRFDRAGDAIAAARWLAAVPRVDAGRIGVLGNSHGGATAATLALREFEAQSGGLIRAVVNYYGPCREPARQGDIPMLALAGEDDDWSYPARTCRSFQSTLVGRKDVTVQTYPGVVHSFDNPTLTQRRSSEGHAMQYDAAAAEDSFRRVRAFLARSLAPR